MKIITLNIWEGRLKERILKFLQSNLDVDIFCFQELYNNALRSISNDSGEVALQIFSDIQLLLSQHKGFFVPLVGREYGLGIFIKKEIDVIDKGHFLIHSDPNDSGLAGHSSRRLQWLKCLSNQKIYYVLNVHGLWNGINKTDTDDRILQSRKIKEFITDIPNPIILCGDFNLRPDTKSIQLIDTILNNLIKLYDIKSTRTKLYDKQEKFADYIFVSRDINVSSFRILEDEVSNHSPLFLEFVIE